MSTESSPVQDVPDELAELIEEFSAVSAADRLQLLLEVGDELPDLPERLADVELEQVHECQSPLFLTVEVSPASPETASDDRVVSLFFKAPPEAPTTRGFAGILHQGLDGSTAQEVLAVPDDVPFRFGLAEAVSPLRLRGMVAMLARIKRQVRLLTASAEASSD